MKKVILWVNSLLWWPHHDNWAFLFYWDNYIWISSERLDRIKMSSWYSYKESKSWLKVYYNYDKCISCINYCLSEFGLDYTDVDLLVYLEWLPNEIINLFPRVKKIVWIYNHHLVHAYSSYYTSWFDWNTTCIVMDWQWKRIEDWKDYMLLQSFYDIKNEEFNLFHETWWTDFNKIWIWTLYEMVTQLLWFSSEGTTMWLSSYWNDRNIFDFNLLKKYNNFDYYINDEIIWKKYNNKFVHRDQFKSLLWISEAFLEKNIIPYWNSSNIAYQLQKEVEESVLYLVKKSFEITKNKNLCISWWVGLNSVLNRRIIKETPYENVYVHPSVDDSGLALWCALYWRKLLYWNWKYIFKNFNFWRIYNDEEILKYLSLYNDKIQYSRYDEIENKTAYLLNKGMVIAWFQWWSESWPRSLWNRSILARPDSVTLRDKVNDIKKRERWRPLAPSVIHEYAKSYFDISWNSKWYKYMLVVVEVLENFRKTLSWVTHVDWTARVQLVSNEDNELFYSLLKKFYELSWLPLLLNTSFNSKWEPIVESPDDALKMFLSTDLDYLVMWNYLIKKSNIYEEYSFKSGLLLDDKLYERWKSTIPHYEDLIKRILSTKNRPYIVKDN